MNDCKIITVRVRPHAKRTVIKETMSDGSIKIDLAAPADEGKANAELLRFLAEHFSVPKDHVELLSGQTSRIKKVKITPRVAP
ncbi:MAG: YggU family protein [Candidatus Peribacteraceae bacterium]|nr:YggU family protein [Candidatus Peribacteraceae bacterium]